MKIIEDNYKIKIGTNGQLKNCILLNIKGRIWNFKESYDGTEPDLDLNHIIWIKWSKLEQDDQSNDANEISINVSDLSEALSNFGDINVVKDSECSWYVKYVTFEEESIDGEFDQNLPLEDSRVIEQIQIYLQNELPDLKYEVRMFENAEKFHASNIYT